MKSFWYRCLLLLALPVLPFCHAFLALLEYDWWHMGEDYRKWRAAFRKGSRLVGGE